jgi:hypothetical protein
MYIRIKSGKNKEKNKIKSGCRWIDYGNAPIHSACACKAALFILANAAIISTNVTKTTRPPSNTNKLLLISLTKIIIL